MDGPSQSVSAFAQVSTLTAGLRLEPLAGRWRLFVDAHGGVALSGPDTRAAVDVGFGLDVPLNPSVSLGPFLRYTQVFQPGDLAVDEDARLLIGGVSLSLQARAPDR
ncbi:MAG: hypothetical protein HY909_26670 [Deltaproteobacteria bacterium]|nr:hypothetical protein [Deltaproteobacteria bacterium]